MCRYLTSTRACRMFSCSLMSFHCCLSSVRGSLSPSTAAIVVVQRVKKTCQSGRRVLVYLAMSVCHPDRPVSICTNRHINILQLLLVSLTEASCERPHMPIVSMRRRGGVTLRRSAYNAQHSPCKSTRGAVKQKEAQQEMIRCNCCVSIEHTAMYVY